MTAPANARRGEVACRIGGRDYRLCLTLGGLAELETAFGVEDLGALGRRFAAGSLSAADVARLLGAGLRGGGHGLGDDEVRAMSSRDLPAMVEAVSRLLVATFGDPRPDPYRPQGAEAARRPVRSPGTT